MSRALAILVLTAALFVLLAGSVGAATAVTARYQLRGHLPELGERPTMRVFVTQTAYDTYRNSLGEANVFPPASALFMSFDKDILALYTRGNDTGGRCIGTQVTASFSGDTLSGTASWQAGTCGAPSTAHYPFILVAFSRTATDGTAWLAGARSVCLAVETQDTNACATLAGASAPPSATPVATATSSPAPASPTAQPTATRSLTPTQSAAASPTSAPQSAAPSPTRSPAAAASPPATAADTGSNILLYAMLIAIVFLVLLSLVLSRGGRRR